MIAFRECWYSGKCKIKQLAVEVKAAPTLGTPSCNRAGESFSVSFAKTQTATRLLCVPFPRVCYSPVRYLLTELSEKKSCPVFASERGSSADEGVVNWVFSIVPGCGTTAALVPPFGKDCLSASP